MQHLNLTISGKVQGVGFRYFTRSKARELELNGFVVNQKDGTVYIEVEGEGEMLNQFVQWCYEGSPPSEVTKVDVSPGSIKNFQDFIITT